MTDYSAVRTAALNWFRSKVGQTEHGGNNIIFVWNDVKPEWMGQAWCAAANVDAYLHAGIDLRKWMDNPYYCPYLEAGAKKIGAWKTSGPKDGDMVIYGTSRLATHTGLAWPNPATSTYRAVEGNTSKGDAGSQTNGDGIYVRERQRSFIRGWVDMGTVIDWMVKNGKASITQPTKPATQPTKPATQPTKPATQPTGAPAFPGRILKRGTKGNDVRTFQQQMGRRGWRIVADGEFGPDTEKVVRDFQKEKGLAVDGQVGPKAWAAAWTAAVTK